MPAATAIPYPGSTSPGAPARKSCGYSANRSNEQKQPDNSPGVSATAWKACYKTNPADAKRINARFAEIEDLLLDALDRWDRIEARARGE